MSDKPKLCARLDISKASQAGDLELGEEVTIVLRGKVRTLRGPEEGIRGPYDPIPTTSGKKGKEEKYTYPGSIEIEITKMDVKGTSGFEGLADEE